MLCHECALAGTPRPAVGLCRFCLVAVCKAHLLEIFARATTMPQDTCHHLPGEAVDRTSAARLGSGGHVADSPAA
jgi:hypothetical protein